MNRKYGHVTVYPKDQKLTNPKLAEIIKDALWVHEQHTEKHENEAGIWEFSIKIFNQYAEYAMFEFRDQKTLSKVELNIYYRFSKSCSLFLSSQILQREKSKENSPCTMFRFSL